MIVYLNSIIRPLISCETIQFKHVFLALRSNLHHRFVLHIVYTLIKGIFHIICLFLRNTLSPTFFNLAVTTVHNIDVYRTHVDGLRILPSLWLFPLTEHRKPFFERMHSVHHGLTITHLRQFNSRKVKFDLSQGSKHSFRHSIKLNIIL